MKIRTHYDPKPIPSRDSDWSAIDQDTYDGAPDSRTNQIGWGATEQAIADLLDQLKKGQNERRVGSASRRPRSRCRRRLAGCGRCGTRV
jgi:hypothetical protein